MYIKCALFIENYLHFMKNYIRPPYEKLKPLKSAFIENSNFENNRDPWPLVIRRDDFYFWARLGLAVPILGAHLGLWSR